MSINLNTPNLFGIYAHTLNRAFYDLGFEAFCEVTDLDPSYRNSFEQFQQFQTCVRAMNLVDLSTWETLLKTHLPRPDEKALSNEPSITKTL